MGSTKSTPRLAVECLTRRFDDREVVSEVSLSIMPGAVTCLLGQSGCGKSTTLRLIAGVDRQNSGRVLIDGNVVSDSRCHMPPEQRPVGLLFQDLALFPHLTAAENVAFGLTCGRRERRRRVEELFSKVNLCGYENSYPHELSGGEQQRVALARALAPRPGIMLLDEPFSSLDDRLRDGIREETIAMLKEENTAVLLVTHDPVEAMQMGEEIAVMRNGRIVQFGEPIQLYLKPADRDIAAFFSDINMVHSVVSNGSADTVFGEFDAPGIVDGTEVEIVVRPQHVRIDFDRNGNGPVPTQIDGVAARGTVHRARFLGTASLVEFKLESDQSIIKAVVPSVFLPREGVPLWLSIRRTRCHLFPCRFQSGKAKPLESARSGE